MRRGAECLEWKSGVDAIVGGGQQMNRDLGPSKSAVGGEVGGVVGGLDAICPGRRRCGGMVRKKMWRRTL